MSIRVGIIGTGFGAQVHAPILINHPEFEVVSLCSMRAGKAQVEALRLGISTAFDDWRLMMAEVPLDLVVIATQPVYHEEMTVFGLNSGLHVLCEKPPALNVAQAKNMQEIAGKNNRHLFINFQWRYLPERQNIKQVLYEGLTGDFIHVNWSESWGILNHIHNDEDSWNWRLDKGGGMLGAVGSHMIDTLHFWFGPLSKVQGFTVSQIDEQHGISGLESVIAEDSFMFNGKFTRGGTCSLQFIATTLDLPTRIEIFGTKGTILVEGKNLKITSETSNDLIPINVPNGMNTSKFPPEIKPYVHVQWMLYSDLAKQLCGEIKPSLPTFRDAVMVQAVMDSLRNNDN